VEPQTGADPWHKADFDIDFGPDFDFTSSDKSLNETDPCGPWETPPHIRDPLDENHIESPPDLAEADTDSGSDFEDEAPAPLTPPPGFAPLQAKRRCGRSLLGLLKKFVPTFRAHCPKNSPNGPASDTAPPAAKPKKAPFLLPPPFRILHPNGSFGNHPANEHGEEEATESQVHYSVNTDSTCW
jgi:hypothetical protein